MAAPNLVEVCRGFTPGIARISFSNFAKTGSIVEKLIGIAQQRLMSGRAVEKVSGKNYLDPKGVGIKTIKISYLLIFPTIFPTVSIYYLVIFLRTTCSHFLSFLCFVLNQYFSKPLNNLFSRSAAFYQGK